MSNLSNNIKVTFDDTPMYGKRAHGEHKVECMIPLGYDCVNPPLEYMRELVKAKVVTYFYGNVLRELNDFRNKHCQEMKYEAMNDLTTLIDRILKGEITDGKELRLDKNNP